MPANSLPDGIWSGIPMPWKNDETLDPDALRRLIHRCAHNRSDGIYVCGTTGEFHAMDLRQFTAVVEVFTQEMRRHPHVGMQVGCGASSLKQALERLRIASSFGVENIQMNLPGWLTLTDDEILYFYQSIADRMPHLKIIVYDVAASGRIISEEVWQKLILQVPSIVGAKITYEAPKLLSLIRTLRPDFRFFAVENTFFAMSQLGINGVTAWLSYSLPQMIGDMWAAVKAKDWARFKRDEALVKLLHEIKSAVRSQGYRGGIIDRLMGLASGFLDPVFARSLAPWRAVDLADVAWVRQAIVARLGPEVLKFNAADIP